MPPTFQATYDGEPLIKAYQTRLKGGVGAYNVVRIWEVEAMIALGMTEESYAEIPVKQRARMIAARQVPKMVEALSHDEQIKALRKGGS